MTQRFGAALIVVALALGCGGSDVQEEIDSGTPGVDCTAASAAEGEMPARATCGIASCHNSDFAGQRMGVGLPAQNLTPDETGLAGWTTGQVARATLDGVRPDGTTLCPSMPRYRSIGLSEAEACDIAAHLLSRDPIANDVPDTCR